MKRILYLLLLAAVARLALADVDFGSQVWRFQAGDSVTSSPVLDSSENVYFGSLDGFVYSLSGDGTFRWRFDTGDWVDSSPVLSRDESTVYVGSWSNRLHALDASNGASRWSYETDSLVFASPAVAADGTIYFGSSDGFLYALSPAGDLKWEVEVGGELDSSPAIDAAGNVYLGSSTGVVSCFSASGVELWSWEVPSEPGADGRELGVTSSPMLTAAGDVVVGCQNFFVYALDGSTGALRWEYETGGIIEGSVVEGMGRSCIVGGRDGYLYSFSWDGELNWKTKVGANYYSTPCVDGMGRIYAGALKGVSEGRLLVLSSEGEVLWQTDFDSFVDSSPLLGPDGTVYVGNNDGSLYALEGGDKLASLGWSSFRGGVEQRRSLQGYVDLSGSRGELRIASKRIEGTDRIVADYLIRGGGPLPVEIRALGSGLEESVGQTAYSLSLAGSSGEMAFSEALVPIEGSFDGALRGWLEPGAYTVEAINESLDGAAFFLEIRVR